jgi:hypothetical protein
MATPANMPSKRIAPSSRSCREGSSHRAVERPARAAPQRLLDTRPSTKPSLVNLAYSDPHNLAVAEHVLQRLAHRLLGSLTPIEPAPQIH